MRNCHKLPCIIAQKFNVKVTTYHLDVSEPVTNSTIKDISLSHNVRSKFANMRIVPVVPQALKL